ncbi:MAG: 2-phosphosulfolactate phosphatase [Terriglobales bacterium]
MKRSVVIDCFPSSVARYRHGYAVVAIDVIRATTVAITAIALGRRCFVAESLESAQHIAARLREPLLAGELGGDMPAGFDMNNSPAELALRDDVHRPLVMLSSSGTQLMYEASCCDEPGYIACLRNSAATARYLSRQHPQVAIIGAGSRNEFREEDQMCCAWIGEQLLNDGYVPENTQTMEIIERWRGLPPSACSVSNSIGYLRRTNQLRDFDFILAHINDLDATYTMHHGDVAMEVAPAGKAAIRAA